MHLDMSEFGGRGRGSNSNRMGCRGAGVDREQRAQRLPMRTMDGVGGGHMDSVEITQNTDDDGDGLSCPLLLSSPVSGVSVACKGVHPAVDKPFPCAG